jgi:hypothetical protein
LAGGGNCLAEFLVHIAREYVDVVTNHFAEVKKKIQELLKVVPHLPKPGLRIRIWPAATNLSAHRQKPGSTPLYTLDNPALYVNTHDILTARGGAVG